MRVKFDAPAGQWLKATDAYEKIIADAITRAMRNVAKKAKKLGDDRIKSAGFKNRKWQLSVINYPKRGTSLLPEAWIHSKVNFLDVFQEGADIIGNPLLWLPLPSVPQWPGDPTRQMSPKKFVQTFGNVLITIKRPGKTPLLGQRVRTAPKAQPFGRFATRGQLKRGLSAKTGQVTMIPLFVGVPAATIAKRFDVTTPIKQAFEDLPKEYLLNLAKYEGR